MLHVFGLSPFHIAVIVCITELQQLMFSTFLDSQSLKFMLWNSFSIQTHSSKPTSLSELQAKEDVNVYVNSGFSKTSKL